MTALPTVAIVLGGADCVWDEYIKAKELCLTAQVQYRVYVTNDMIAEYPHAAIACTLHAEVLPVWLRIRQERHRPPHKQVWCHIRGRPGSGITDSTRDWGGSVGLFATKVALQQSNRKVLLCGIPMQPEAGHFKRKRAWDAAGIFAKRFAQKIPEIKPHVRSFSGWTAAQLGIPSIEFLKENIDAYRAQSP